MTVTKYVKLLLPVCFFFYFRTSCMAQTGETIRKESVYKLQEFQKRGGLPNIFHKIATQRQIKIAYLGGSITGAQDGWRDLTFNWFKLNYPTTAFYQINYAVGGTGSLLGVFRLDSLLEQKPDLLFVEFAVNDENDMSVNRRIPAMEGIVRKTWAALPNTDICFIYTTAKRFCDTMMMKNKRMDAVLEHEKVAAYYNIPSIDMGIPVIRLAAAGKLLLSADASENARAIVFWKTGDDYHPLQESGHTLYAGTVVKHLQQMSKNKSGQSHVLSSPSVPDNWQNSRMIFPFQAELQGHWDKFAADKKDALAGPVPCLYKASPGAIMKFTFTGSELGIYDVIGPGTGSIEVTIDGKMQEIKRFNHNCHFWHRHNIFLDKLTEGRHDVQIKVSDKEFDKTSVMKPGDDKSKYAKYDWYPSTILITGTLIK